MKTTKFKPSEVGPIPVDWEVKRLRDVCDKIRNGYGYDFNAKYLKAACQNKQASTLEVVKEMAKDSLYFEPGEKFCYGFGLDDLY